MTIAKEFVKPMAHAMFKPLRNAQGFGGETVIPAGHTYIGQMISHDIVPPTTKDMLTRKVTAELNLDSIYGSAPLYQFSHFPE